MNKDFLTNFQKFKIPLSQSYLNAFSEFERTLNKINSFNKFLQSLRANPKGIYLYGPTGCGKTTLMNSFFNAVEAPKINMHFYDYFLDVSRLLAKYKVGELAQKLSQKVKVLCFDEFFIETIADAKMLNELFEELIKRGVIIFLTSNFNPDKLYENGFNREAAFPRFTNFLFDNLRVLSLVTSIDFRHNESPNFANLITSDLPTGFINNILQFDGREIKCQTLNDDLIIDYQELLVKPRGMVDFVYICRRFERIFISNFKPFSLSNKDELLRFRNFIDIAYMRYNLIHIHGLVNVDDIIPEKLLEDIKIRRMYSRLKEMSSLSFLSNNKKLRRKWATEARILLENL